ncbi:hypothetical protein [Pyrococcus yayanosii]|uniref:hypothetical protein n=1 Tax=Pyrococcus yayanosii TaxID=1008460 RepID=UPI00064E61A8|nr:hypothetical protein [Pyrococcus yayanosii]
MPVFYTPIRDVKSLSLLDEVSRVAGELEEGSMAGVITADPLSTALLKYSSMAKAQASGIPVYYLDVMNGLSPSLLERFGGDPSSVLMARVYSFRELLEGVEMVSDGSFVFVSSFPLLKGADSDGMLELRRLVDLKALFLVLLTENTTLNELDLMGEVRKSFLLPEMFEQLLVLRTGSYRGHYRLRFTVLRTYAERLEGLGEHDVPIDSTVALLMGRSSQDRGKGGGKGR